MKHRALELGIPVSHNPADLRTLDPLPELGDVVAFGQLVRPVVLASISMVNIHFSLLPLWRGAAPVERSLLAGDDTTGVCLMAVEEGLDTGAVFARELLAIRSDHSASILRAELAELGNRALLELLSAERFPTPIPQEGEPTYAHKLTREDRHLLPHMPARQLDRIVRVGDAWCDTERGLLKVHEATVVCLEGMPDSVQPGRIVVVGRDVVMAGAGVSVSPTEVLRLTRVQPAGKAVMEASAWAAGLRGASLVFS